jgi:DNA-binding NarL/FixJ family response regulator
MSSAITSLLPTASFTSANSSPNTEATQAAQPTTHAQADTVTLTEAQQVYQLYNEGQQVPQIATTLSLSVEMVNNYLGITSASNTPT